jgi:RNA polymerase sigma-70 factor (ECF subfamily)
MDAARRQIIHQAMIRLSDGDRTAFDIVLDELWPVILSFAQRGVGAGADAEDVAQEVFLRICSRITEFDRTRDAVSWAFGIASYEILTHRRKVQRRREAPDLLSLALQADQTASQEDLLVQREVRRALEQVIGTLTEDDRRVLGLVPGGEVDAASGSTLRKRKQRALSRLRALSGSIHGQS